jgi:uncharacterized protein (DUF488 family)
VGRNLIYTVGTSRHAPSEFIDLLKYYGIQLLVDVRRFPTSNLEHFKRENLEKLLKENSIDYIYLGKELGGYRAEGYENYMKTEEFKKGLELLRDLAKEKVCVIMCSERFAWRCHRRFIAQALREENFETIHIIEEDRIWKPKIDYLSIILYFYLNPFLY